MQLAPCKYNLSKLSTPASIVKWCQNTYVLNNIAATVPISNISIVSNFRLTDLPQGQLPSRSQRWNHTQEHARPRTPFRRINAQTRFHNSPGTPWQGTHPENTFPRHLEDAQEQNTFPKHLEDAQEDVFTTRALAKITWFHETRHKREYNDASAAWQQSFNGNDVSRTTAGLQTSKREHHT